MIDLKLQLFGGRGSGGGKVEEGMSKPLDEDMSEMWSEDPELYQALSDPARFEAKKNELLEDGWSQEEIDEFKGYADELRIKAESSMSGEATLYRGERFSSLEAAEAKYYVGAEITTSQLTSYSTNKQMASDYADYYGNNAPRVVISNTSTTGNFVGIRTNHTGSGADEETIVPKGVTSKVVSTRLDRANNVLYVEMENSAKPRRK